MLEPSPSSSGSLQQKQASWVPRMSIQFREPIYSVTFSHNHFICSAPSRILVYSLVSKETTSIKVCTSQFLVVQLPPYVFACIITQFIYCYSEQALKDVTKIAKFKISKLNVRAICGFNKGYFMAGSNRSPLPGGNLTDRRSIYFLEDLTNEKKNKPLWEIPLPKSNNPVSILEIQNPYLLCYCQPNVFVINPFHKQILLSFHKEFESLRLLEGRYSLNCLNMIGISYKDKAIISVDVEKYPIFGVELNEYKERANAICQSREGNLYACLGPTIYSYNIFKKDKKVLKTYPPTAEVLYLTCSPKNVLFALVASMEEIEEVPSDKAESDLTAKELELAKSLKFPPQQKENQEKESQGEPVFMSGSFDVRNMEERRYIEVFML